MNYTKDKINKLNVEWIMFNLNNIKDKNKDIIVNLLIQIYIRIKDNKL